MVRRKTGEVNRTAGKIISREVRLGSGIARSIIRAMISASLEEITSVLRGWSQSKTPVRLIGYVHGGWIEANCSVLSVTEVEIGLQIAGQPRGAVCINIPGCEFSFGCDDVPPYEEEFSRARFDTGITILTRAAETFVLLEIVERS
jgi:hypothetical protein